MNYCFVRRDLLVYGAEQTLRKEVRHADPPSATNQGATFRPQRFHSNPEDTTVAEAAEVDPKGEGFYHFYLAVAEADLKNFGIPFCDLVETRMNMRPCLTIRDIPIGSHKFETMAEFLDTRCGGKMVIVVSEQFASSDECQFLVHYAKTLDPYAKHQNLIPLIIDKRATVPRVLEGLCSINYNAAVREKWLGKRLWEAIHTNGQRSNVHRIRTLSAPH